MIAKKYFLVFTFLLLSGVVLGQDDFCNAVNTIIRDAPNRFRNIKGKQVESNMNVVVYECGIKVPGTIASRFVVSMGFFYEGGLLQTENKDDLKPLYDKYKNLLTSCLAPQGYIVTTSDNFYPGLADYKKVVFMPEIKSDTPPAMAPAHATLEATYNKDLKFYTLVLYIFEH